MNNEQKILRGMCAIAARNIVDKAESDCHSFKRKRDDLEVRSIRFTLFYVPCETSGKRLSLAKKLEAKGLVKLDQYRKGGAWTYQFADFEIVKKIYLEAFEIVSVFDFIRGDGWISLPQFSKTSQGFSVVDCLGQKMFELVFDANNTGDAA